MTLVPVPVSVAAAKVVAEFLERFGGISGFVESILDVPKGYLQYWSQQNLIRWIEIWQAENKQRKADGRKPIPPSLLMPALSKIAMEDDDDMLTMWARLFANFQDPDCRLEPAKIYIHLLSEMQPLDAMLLKYIVTILPEKQRPVSGGENIPLGFVEVSSAELASEMRIPDQDVVLALHNLSRLGCLSDGQESFRSVRSGDAELHQASSIITQDVIFFPNALGAALVNACSTSVGDASPDGA